MLPSFSRVKKKIYEEDIKPFFDSVRMRDPLISNINHTVYHEGNITSYETVEGEVVKPDTQSISADMQITIEDVEKQDINIVLRKVEKAAEEFSSQQAQMMFRTVSQVTEKTGNTLDAGGQKLTPELFLELVEKVQIDFDPDTGQPSLPTLYIHPNMTPQVKQMIKDADADPTHKAKFDQIIEQKRKEWNEREAYRKLVD